MSGASGVGPPTEPGRDQPRRFGRSRWTVAAIAVIVVLAITGIVLATRPGQIDQMHELPELYVVYPGAVVLRDIGDAVPVAGSPMVRRLYGADASIEAVQYWYRHELTARGWLPGADSSVGTSQDELAVCGWHTDTYRFRLSFWRPEAWLQLEPGGPAYTSVIEMVIIAAPSEYNQHECGDSPLRYWTPSPAPTD